MDKELLTLKALQYAVEEQLKKGNRGFFVVINGERETIDYAEINNDLKAKIEALENKNSKE